MDCYVHYESMLTDQYLSFSVCYFVWLTLVIVSVIRDVVVKRLITYLAVAAERKVSVCDNAEEKSAVTVHVWHLNVLMQAFAWFSDLLVEHAEIFWSLFAVDMDQVLAEQPPDTWDSFPLFQIMNDYLRTDGKW